MSFTKVDMQLLRRLTYKFWDKGRERSNRAKGFMDSGPTIPYCVMKHDTMAYSGPPDDAIRAYVCLHCHGAACEPEIKDRGYDFETIPDFAIHAIMDDDVKRQREGSPQSYALGGIGPVGGTGTRGKSGVNSWTAK